MRRSRRGGHGGPEFGGSGEDSFVAVVVTKLTGALLFILLLTMVIMALLPKVADLPGGADAPPPESGPLAIATPEALPEAIVGRPYALALAATGGRAPLRWSVVGDLPEGLTFDPVSGQIRGTPRAATVGAVPLSLRVTDGVDRAANPTLLVVYRPDRPLATASRFDLGLPPVPWRAWLEEGFGFLVLILIHLAGMNALGGLQRWATAPLAPGDEAGSRAVRRRFAAYRIVVRLTTLAALTGLAAWLWTHRGD